MKLWTALRERLSKTEPYTPGVITPVGQQYTEPTEAPDVAPFECEICHKEIADKNDVVCFYAGTDGGLGSFGHNLSFGEPHTRYDKYVCSSQCAHALLDTHLVTWRLKGLFGDPKEEEGYY